MKTYYVYNSQKWSFSTSVVYENLEEIEKLAEARHAKNLVKEFFGESRINNILMGRNSDLIWVNRIDFHNNRSESKKEAVSKEIDRLNSELEFANKILLWE